MKNNIQMPKPPRGHGEPKLRTDLCGRPKYATRAEAERAMQPYAPSGDGDIYCCESGWYHIQIRMD